MPYTKFHSGFNLQAPGNGPLEIRFAYFMGSKLYVHIAMNYVLMFLIGQQSQKCGGENSEVLHTNLFSNKIFAIHGVE
jgi:hypothetical protein